jgi:hypothetical protein
MSRFRFRGEEKRDRILAIKTPGLFSSLFGLGEKVGIGKAQGLFGQVARDPELGDVLTDSVQGLLLSRVGRVGVILQANGHLFQLLHLPQ